MKEYEIIHEIFNQCPGNHSRDQFIEERIIQNPETYLAQIFKQEKDLKIEKTIKEDGSEVYDVMTASIHQRYTFSEI